MFKIGDYVTRKSYNNDILFVIVNINDSIIFFSSISKKGREEVYKIIEKYLENV